MNQKGIEVALVDMGEDAQTVSTYAKRNNIDYAVFLDEDSSVSDVYQLIGVPTYVFIDEAGVIRGVEHFLPKDYEKLLSNPTQK